MLERIGSFVILRELGRGGMGEVYLARDTRLDRQVAIKALPAHLGADPDRLARFQREARVLASLNHPGIGAIYGLEEAAGHQYLILEYVEGGTLADRLRAGAIPVDESLTLARQIAEALEVAHEKGVIHRDLKPGNVMVTPDGVVKVLDFGLARTEEPPASGIAPADLSASPTLSSPARMNSPTIPGAIMGTAGYMSPEQARGKPADRRSDVFAFGCVLYEMITGAMPFPGETVTDSLGAILHREPDWTLLPPATPHRIRELLANCLVKDRRQRLHDIGDARLAIERAQRDPRSDSPPPPRRNWREIVAWAIATLAIAGAIGARLLTPAARVAPDQRALQFTVSAPPGTALNPQCVNAVVSPDGRSLVFIAAEPGRPDRLWVRSFDTVTSRVLEGTEGAALPFWSPDGRSIAYFANGALFRISAQGGPVQRLADAPGGRGGDWSESGVILFAPSSNGPLYTVSQTGGVARPALELNAAIKETGHRFPQFLPGGQRFLYASMTLGRHEEGWTESTWVGTLGSKEARLVCTATSRATFAPGGWILFDRSGALYTQKFDPATGMTSGDEIPTPIRPSGQANYAGSFAVSCSRSGVIAGTIDGQAKSMCVEAGADGQVVRTLSLKPEDIGYLHASPTGEYLAGLLTTTKSSAELRLFDLARGVSSRLVEDPFVNELCWSPDGQWVYYSADRASRDIFRCRVGGTGKPELVHVSGNLWASPKDVTPDGRLLIFDMLDPKNQRDLWVLDTQTKSVRALAAEACNEFAAALSPDASMVAIATDESGEPELYVQEFPEARGRVRVSVSGTAVLNTGAPSNAALRWSRDGSSLMFLDADGRSVRSAVITAKPSLRAGKPTTLMQAPANLAWVEIAPDGKSVFGAKPADGQAPCSVAVTMNWAPGANAADAPKPRP